RPAKAPAPSKGSRPPPERSRRSTILPGRRIRSARRLPLLPPDPRTPAPALPRVPAQSSPAAFRPADSPFDFLPQADLGGPQLAPDYVNGKIDAARDLVSGHAPEEAHLHEPRLPVVLLCQRI